MRAKILLLVFFSTIAIYQLASGWTSSCSTTYAGGAWMDISATPITVTTTGSATLMATAPYSSSTTCGDRYSRAWNWDGATPHIITSAVCPNPTNQPAPECCKKVSFNTTASTDYWVSAHQYSGGASSCGPTSGTITNQTINCNPE